MVLKAGHPGVLVIVRFVFVCIVLVWCIGSGFSSFLTNLASVLYACILMYVCSLLMRANKL